MDDHEVGLVKRANGVLSLGDVVGVEISGRPRNGNVLPAEQFGDWSQKEGVGGPCLLAISKLPLSVADSRGGSPVVSCDGIYIDLGLDREKAVKAKAELKSRLKTKNNKDQITKNEYDQIIHIQDVSAVKKKLVKDYPKYFLPVLGHLILNGVCLMKRWI